MSVPPQGGWQPGPIPPNQGQPYGQPFDPSAYNPQQQPPPPGWQQGSWSHQPGPPPPRGGGLKWLLIAVAVLLVVAVSIGATLLFTRGDGGGGSTPTSGAPSDIASANDTGPVSIITSDPTCQAFNGINNGLASVQANGWSDQRDTIGPAAGWTSDQRDQMDAVANAMRNAADQSVALSKQTPHRVVRELYAQFIAYGREYADSLSSYTPAKNALASVNISAGSALIAICNSITYGSTSRAIALEAVTPPTRVAAIGNPTEPERFLQNPNSSCATWTDRETAFDSETQDWSRLDTSVTGAQWTPTQRAIQQAALPALTAWAGDIEQIGRQSNNPVFEDFAVAASLYIRAYVSSGDTYVQPDSFLTTAAFRFGNTISEACRSVAE